MNTTRIMRVIVAVSILTGVLWTTEQAQSQAKKSPGATTTQQPQDKQNVEKRAGATQGMIHPDVRSKLGKSEDGTVYVLVTLKPLPKEGLTVEQRREMAKEKQDKLLAKLAEGDFKIDHRFATEPRVIGHLSAGGLAKLVKQSDVHAIQLSKFEPGVLPALNNSPDGKMFVIVTMHHPQKDGRQLREHRHSLSDYRKLIRQHSSKVMNRLTHQDFEISSQSQYIPSFTGLIKTGGVDILAVDPDVRVIYLNVVQEMPEPPPVRVPNERKPPDMSQTAIGDTLLSSRADGYTLAGYAPIDPPSGLDAKKPQADQKAKKRRGSTKDPIHPDVRSKLEKSEDGKVYVLISLKPLPKEGLTKDQRKALAKEKQDKLLAGLAEDDFKVDHRFATEPRMIGHLNASGLARLAKQPGAPVVELSRIGERVIPALNESPDGKILVMVSLHGVRKDGRLLREHALPLGEKMELTKQHSSKVIDRLTPVDFEVLNQLSIIPSFIGFIKPSAIEILAVDSDVEAVYVNVVQEMGDH